MKIALASDLFWPMINGISVFTKNLAEQMAKRGHEVVVFAPSQTGDFYVEETEIPLIIGQNRSDANAIFISLIVADFARKSKK
jgi:fructoselysine-6-P-deglycase FrlB-like protein